MVLLLLVLLLLLVPLLLLRQLLLSREVRVSLPWVVGRVPVFVVDGGEKASFEKEKR